MSKVTPHNASAPLGSPVVSALSFDQAVDRIEKVLVRIRHVGESARFPEEAGRLMAEALTSPLSFYRRYARGAFDEETGRPAKGFGSLEKVLVSKQSHRPMSAEKASALIGSVLSQVWSSPQQHDVRGTAQRIATVLFEEKPSQISDGLLASESRFESQVSAAKTVTLEVPTPRGQLLVAREPSGFVTVQVGKARNTLTRAQAEELLSQANHGTRPALPVLDGVWVNTKVIRSALEGVGVATAQPSREPSKALPISQQSNLVAQLADAKRRETPQSLGQSLIQRMTEAGLGQEGGLQDWLQQTAALGGEWTWTTVGLEKQGETGKSAVNFIGVPELFVLEFKPSDGTQGVAGVLDLRDC